MELATFTRTLSVSELLPEGGIHLLYVFLIATRVYKVSYVSFIGPSRGWVLNDFGVSSIELPT